MMKMMKKASLYLITAFKLIFFFKKKNVSFICQVTFGLHSVTLFLFSMMFLTLLFFAPGYENELFGVNTVLKSVMEYPLPEVSL